MYFANTRYSNLVRLVGIISQVDKNCVCRVVVETPVNLTARQRELLKELQATMEDEGSQSSPKKKSFFDRLFD